MWCEGNPCALLVGLYIITTTTTGKQYCGFSKKLKIELSYKKKKRVFLQ